MYLLPKKSIANNQKGAIPLLLLLAFAGIIIYIAAASILPLKDTLLSQLFPKNKIEAANKLVAATNYDPSFATNELLVKFKSTVSKKIKESKDNTGIDSITDKLKKNKIIGFERVARPGKNSNLDDEVYAWYKITLSNKGEIVKGQLNKKDKKLETKSAPTASVQTMQNVIEDLSSDPNIDSVEPNYTIANTQVATTSSLKITSPNGGESYSYGQYPVKITWQTNMTGRCTLYYVTQSGGPTNYNTIDYVDASAQSYDWTATTPSGSSSPQLEKITISCSGVQDYSDNFFTVTGSAPPPPPNNGGDIYPPTPPKNVKATMVNNDYILLSWDSSSDNTGVQLYTIYRNGQPISVKILNTSNTLSFYYEDRSIGSGTTYIYYISATDIQGNVSGYSQTVSATTPTVINQPSLSTKCIRKNPTATITPSSKSGNSGGSYYYYITITNNDSTDCGKSLFILNPNIQKNWTSYDFMGFYLNPGQTSPGISPGNYIRVNTSSDTPTGNYPFQEIVSNFYDQNYKTTASTTVSLTQVSPTISPSFTPNVITSSTPLPTMGSNFPNDPLFATSGSWGQSYDDMWGLKKINAAGAWKQITNATPVIVADIDTGFDRNHPDLKDHMWVNTGESGPTDNEGPPPNCTSRNLTLDKTCNNLDDDGNGYVDDYYGWDFINNDNDPMDTNGHGTHTAGTIAAVVNNGTGVAGVGINTKIMALKTLNTNGTIAAAVAALRYAADMGAKISSNSWGCQCNSTFLDDAVKYEHDKGMTIIAGAGNNNINALDFAPASSQDAITVGATDVNDARSIWWSGYASDWGEKIDVVAPGTDILSTMYSGDSNCSTQGLVVNGKYCHLSGTSMATPHVAGLASLLLSKNPNLTNEQIRQILRLSAVDLGPAGKDNDFGFGRIDANKAVELVNTPVLTPVITSPASRSAISGQSSAIQVWGSADGPNFASYKVEFGQGRTPSNWTLAKSSTTPLTNGYLAGIDPTKLGVGAYTIRLTEYDTSGKSYQYQVFDVQVNNFDITINTPQSFMSIGNTQIIGSALTKNGLAFSNYKLEWGEGTNPQNWTSSGITLASNGTSPVSFNLLGTWDTTQLKQNTDYTLRLSVFAANGTYGETKSIVRVDKDLVLGWPKVVQNRPNYLYNIVPELIDIDGDGVKEVVYVDGQSRIQAFHKDGTALSGFPIILDSGYDTGSPPLIADLDNDGKKELVVSTRSLTSVTARKLFVYRSDGTKYPGWVVPSLSIFSYSDGTPTAVDLNNDGKMELVIADGTTGSTVSIHAFKLNGQDFNGFPQTLQLNSAVSWNGPITTADILQTGKPALVYAQQNQVFVLDQTGTVLPGWPYTTSLQNNQNIVFKSPISFADLDGDGSLELFGLAQVEACGGCNAMLYGFKKDGSLLPNFPINTGSLKYASNWYNAPSVKDMDGDGKDEVIVATDGIKIFDANGLVIQEQNSTYPGNTDVAIADTNGDGIARLASSYQGRVELLNAQANPTWLRDFRRDNSFTTPITLADLDNNGQLELAATSDSTFNLGGYEVYLWEIPKKDTNFPKFEWPQYMQNSSHTGRLVSDSSVINPQPTQSPLPSQPLVTPQASILPSQSQSPSGGNLITTPTPTASQKAAATPIPTPAPIPSDTTPPSVYITQPSNNSGISGKVPVQMYAFDDRAVQSVSLFIDNTLVTTLKNAPYTYIWDTTSLSGNHILSAKATDTSGNIGNSIDSVVTIDNAPPIALMATPKNNQIVSGVVPITVNATDNIGIYKVEYYIDSVLNSVTFANQSSYTYNWDTAYLQTNSAHTIQLKVYDTAGNTTSTSPITVTVSDTVPPTVELISPIDSATVSDIVTIAANASDNVGITKEEYYADGNLLASYKIHMASQSWQSRNYPNGLHTLTIKDYDNAGNVSIDSVSVNVLNADTTPPQPPSNLSAVATSYNSINLTWDAAIDNVGVTGYWIVRNGVTIANTTKTTYVDGTVSANTAYSYELLAYDAKGNVSSPSKSATATTLAQPDAVPPSSVSSVSTDSVSFQQINLSWNTSNDNRGIQSYDIFRGGTKIATVTGSTFGDSNLAAATSYAYTIKPVDSKGHSVGVAKTVVVNTKPLPVSGTIAGIVRNGNGQIVPHAKVTILSGGKKQIVTSTSKGKYVANSVKPGSVSVKVSAKKAPTIKKVVVVKPRSKSINNVTLKK